MSWSEIAELPQLGGPRSHDLGWQHSCCVNLDSVSPKALKLLQDIEEGMRPSLAAQYTGWDDSYKLLQEAVQEHKPDGILGDPCVLSFG